MAESGRSALKSRSGVYALRNVLNGKVYVGKTSRPFWGRWATHRHRLRSGTHPNQHLQAAWSKYGEAAFLFEVLEVIAADQRVQIGRREAHWASKLDANDRKKGYNLAVVLPEGTATVSDETRARLRASRLGKKQSPEAIAKTAAAHRGMKRSAKTRERLRKANTGQKVSKEQRSFLSASRRGVPLSEECKAKMSAVRKGRTPTRLSDQDRADIVRRYESGESRRELALEYGIRPNYVSMLRTKAQEIYENV